MAARTSFGLGNDHGEPTGSYLVMNTTVVVILLLLVLALLLPQALATAFTPNPAGHRSVLDLLVSSPSWKPIGSLDVVLNSG